MPQHRFRKVGTLALHMVAIGSLCVCVSPILAQNASLGRGVNPQGTGGQGTGGQGNGGQINGAQPQDPRVQPIGARQQAQSPIPQDAFLPRPFPELNEEHQKYLDQLLTYWEYSSGQIEMFECKFDRWQYDPVFGPKERDENGQLLAKTISSGILKYKAPDKGLFAVENIWQWKAVTNPEENPYQLTGMQERWVCDGQNILEYEFQNETIVNRELPPDMKGQGLKNGPLPFLFGAKKDELLARYWLRVITPKDTVGEYWIEAYPKFPMDARNYQKVVVILDQDDFLPKATELFDPNFDPQRNPARQVFRFKEREIFNASGLSIPAIMARFKREFFEPKAPRGWKVIEEPYEAQTAQTPAEGINR